MASQRTAARETKASVASVKSANALGVMWACALPQKIFTSRSSEMQLIFIASSFKSFPKKLIDSQRGAARLVGYLSSRMGARWILLN